MGPDNELEWDMDSLLVVYPEYSKSLKSLSGRMVGKSSWEETMLGLFRKEGESVAISDAIDRPLHSEEGRKLIGVNEEPMRMWSRITMLLPPGTQETLDYGMWSGAVSKETVDQVKVVGGQLVFTRSWAVLPVRSPFSGEVYPGAGAKIQFEVGKLPRIRIDYRQGIGWRWVTWGERTFMSLDAMRAEFEEVGALIERLLDVEKSE